MQSSLPWHHGSLFDYVCFFRMREVIQKMQLSSNFYWVWPKLLMSCQDLSINCHRIINFTYFARIFFRLLAVPQRALCPLIRAFSPLLVFISLASLSLTITALWHPTSIAPSRLPPAPPASTFLGLRRGLGHLRLFVGPSISPIPST